MEETLKMMKQILTGKECKVDETELINQYKEGLYPNILAYFYCNNYTIICKTNALYSIITDEDKASFCLQELDKCLLNYNSNNNAKFITYFLKCYKNRLRTETELLNTLKRKVNINYENLDEFSMISNDIEIEDINFLDKYELTKQEKFQCKLLNMGYTIKEIAKIYKLTPIAIYKRQEKIKQKILNYNINFA